VGPEDEQGPSGLGLVHLHYWPAEETPQLPLHLRVGRQKVWDLDWAYWGPNELSSPGPRLGLAWVLIVFPEVAP